MTDPKPDFGFPTKVAECAQRAECYHREATGQDSAQSAHCARGAGDFAKQSGALARALLDTAAEVEAAEHQIKQEILTAARAGDCALIVEIVEKWLTEPPVEVLSNALPSSRGAR
jgi:hypothetical protein